MVGHTYSEYSFTPASAITANTNYLPSLRTVVKTAFSGEEWTDREAAFSAVDIRSASAFTVALNEETTIKAVLVGNVYVARYEGAITKIVFAANTTVTDFWVAWYRDRKNHNIPTFHVSGSQSVTVKDGFGRSVVADANGGFELERGYYEVTALGQVHKLVYNLETDLYVIADVAGATVTLGADLTYNGTEQTKTVASVVVGGVTLTANTDYEVKYNKGTNAGSYTMGIFGKGMYAGQKPVEWTIAKATPTMSLSAAALSVAAGETGTVTVTTNSDGALSVASSDEAVATASIEETTVTVAGVAEGSANVTVSQAASDNYNAATDAVCAVTVTA